MGKNEKRRTKIILMNSGKKENEIKYRKREMEQEHERPSFNKYFLCALLVLTLIK